MQDYLVNDCNSYAIEHNSNVRLMKKRYITIIKNIKSNKYIGRVYTLPLINSIYQIDDDGQIFTDVYSACSDLIDKYNLKNKTSLFKTITLILKQIINKMKLAHNFRCNVSYAYKNGWNLVTENLFFVSNKFFFKKIIEFEKLCLKITKVAISKLTVFLKMSNITKLQIYGDPNESKKQITVTSNSFWLHCVQRCSSLIIAAVTYLLIFSLVCLILLRVDIFIFNL